MTMTTEVVITGVKAVFFDLDDTLFDRRSSLRLTLQLIVEDFRDLLGRIEEDILLQAFLEADAESIRDFNAGASIEVSRLARSRGFLRKLKLDERLAQPLTAAYLAHYPVFQTPVAGAESIIRTLATRFSLGIISNGSSEVQHRKLERLGLEGLFRCVILSEEIGVRKPDPNIFLRAVAEMRMMPRKCLHVGDNFDADIVGAKNAGLRSCWFNSGAQSLPAGGVVPDVEIRHLAELVGVLGFPRC